MPLGPFSRRRFLAALSALAVTACNPGELTSKPVARIALPRQVTLLVPVPDQPSADRLAVRTRDYQNQNPNTKIDLRPVPGMPRGPFDADKWVELLYNLASAAAFDAVVGWDVWAPGMIDRGILRPLDPYLVDIGRPLERYFMNSSVQAFRRWGRVWMLPWQAQPVMLFYNRWLFDQAGIDPPTTRWTWLDVEVAGGPLTRGSDKAKTWGYDVGGGPEVLVFQNGGRLVDDPIEPTKPTLNDPANVEAFEWVEGLVQRLKISPGIADFRQFEGRMGAFAGGQIAMRLDRMGVRGGAYVGSPAAWSFPWSAVAPPGRVLRATTANFQSWGILVSSAQVDDAWGVIRHLCTQLPGEAKIDGVPAFLTLQSSPDLARLLPEGTEPYLRALDEAVPTPPIPAANTISQLLSNALFRTVAGQASAADALRSAQQDALKAWNAQPAPAPAASGPPSP
ncbi:MAG TPA: extracellular solute-binding protein [Chloroflexota bacterium]|nr:extracellular solute-binding protein [Chloroflexota bacterium]